MKKLISLILIFVMLVSSPLQIFAQELVYKPAKSFEYDYYVAGQSPEYMAEFIVKLEKDMQNSDETFTDADTNFRSELTYTGRRPSPQDYYNSFGTTEKIKEAYNDFLYFNSHPQESPYYVDTALMATEGAKDGDILHILNRYETLTQDISKLLVTNNHKYDVEMGVKHISRIPTVMILVVLEICFAKAFLAAKAVTTTGIAGKLAKIGFYVALFAADIWLTDFIAREAQNMYTILGQVVEPGFFGIIINSVEDTGLFKAAQQAAGADREAREFLEDTKFYRRYTKTDPSYKIADLDNKIAEAQKIVDFYDKGEVEHTVAFHKLIASSIIKAYGTNRDGIPEINDDNEEQVLAQIYNQNKYAMDLARQEMLRTYYALRFIRAELSNINDPLRFDRATIDLATVYKIMIFQKQDNSFIKFNNKFFKFNDRSEYMLFMDALAKYRALDPKIFYDNPEDEANKKPTRIGYEILDATSTQNTYPTLLNRALVNCLVQLISIVDRETDKAFLDGINATVRERTNAPRPDLSYLNGTNLTERQKRACSLGYCGTK